MPYDDPSLKQFESYYLSRKPKERKEMPECKAADQIAAVAEKGSAAYFQSDSGSAVRFYWKDGGILQGAGYGAAGQLRECGLLAAAGRE